MFYNGRKNIAFIIADANSDFQQELCGAVSRNCIEFDYNLAIFTCFSAFGTDSQNSKGEFNIPNLIPYDRFDGILVLYDSWPDNYRSLLDQALFTHAKCPVVSLRSTMGNYPCVLIEEKNAIREIVRHLYNEHNYKSYAFMSGPMTHHSAVTRYESFCKELKSLGISFNDDYFFEGDFWKNKAGEAADYFLSLNPLPEVIVCANDYMATSLCHELLSRGYQIPEDFALTGYDNIKECAISTSPLTTASVSAEDMAKVGVQLLKDLIEDKHPKEVQYVYPRLVVRNSCGCSHFEISNLHQIVSAQVDDYNHLYYQSLYHSFTSIELERLINCFNIGDYLHITEYDDNDICSIHICLGEGSGETYPKYHSSRLTYPKECTSIYSLLNRSEIKTKTFSTCDLLPKEASVDKPMVYYFTPLHYQNFTLGYIATSFYHNVLFNRSYPSWTTIISNAIENLRIRNKNKQLLEELNNLYLTDPLTGLSNRRAFTSNLERVDKSNKKTGKAYCVISIDMDNLKVVNDHYGHMQGDLALKTIADAMTHAARHNEICARIGGDEYAVIGENYTEEMAEDFISDFYRYLKEYNEESISSYDVDASYGYAFSDESDDMHIEEVLNLSDDRLYINKKHKKVGRG